MIKIIPVLNNWNFSLIFLDILYILIMMLMNIMNILVTINNYIDYLIASLGIYGPILGCLLICVESILPFLPLSAFITLNFLAFGNFFGFVISWFFTVVGCMMSFFIFRKKVKKWFDRKTKDKKRIENIMKTINKVNFSQLVVIIAIPFTPAFLVNIAAGLSKISYKKFLCALLIGKIFLVYFWGYIGVSLIQSFSQPIIILRVIILMIVAYFISYFINKKFKLD